MPEQGKWEGWILFLHFNSPRYAPDNLKWIDWCFQEQPECIKDSETLHFDCGGWGVSAEWEVPQVTQKLLFGLNQGLISIYSLLFLESTWLG